MIPYRICDIVNDTCLGLFLCRYRKTFNFISLFLSYIKEMCDHHIGNDITAILHSLEPIVLASNTSTQVALPAFQQESS